MFQDLFTTIDFIYVFISAILFLAGMYIAPYMVQKNMSWLLIYPRWMAQLMEKYFKDNYHFIPLFLIILFLNNLSLFTAFVCGFTVILPPLYAFFTGFNITVVSYDLMGWRGLWHLLVNPVAWLEFPAAWLSLALGNKIALAILNQGFEQGLSDFYLLLPLYLKYVVTLLIIAAILETALIKFAQNENE